MAIIRTAFLLALSFTLLSTIASASDFLQLHTVAETNDLGVRLNALLKRLSQPPPSPSPSPLSGKPNANKSKSPSPRPSAKPKPTPSAEVKPNVPNYKVQVSRPLGKAASSVIVLHGLNGSPERLSPIVTIARLFGLTQSRIVFPAAPVAYVTYRRRRETSWFDVYRRAPNQENGEQLRAAAAGIAKLVREETELHGVPRGKVVVIGLSQGGAVALAMLLTQDVPVAGIVAVATWLPLYSTWNANNISKRNLNKEVLFLHGDRDRAIPIKEARQSRTRVAQLGFKTQFKAYPGAEHSLEGSWTSVVVDIIPFLRRTLA